ncbi:MAG: hypothetical protein IPP42_00940 [Saprospiraceae bacterium]|nr:hypothetical protein [Saprospiraceae bacterium]
MVFCGDQRYEGTDTTDSVLMILAGLLACPFTLDIFDFDKTEPIVTAARPLMTTQVVKSS